MAAQEEKDGVESVPADGANLLLCDLGEGEGSAALQVNVIRKRKCGQRGEWCSLEEVGGGSVCASLSERKGTREPEGHALTLEKLEEIRYCLALVLQEQGLVRLGLAGVN